MSGSTDFSHDRIHSTWRGVAAAFALLVACAGHAAVQLDGLNRTTGDRDARNGYVAPLPQATSLVAAQGLDAKWNRFGTVHTLQRQGAPIATGLTGEPETAARSWMKANRALFRLSDASIDGLELFRDSKLNQSGVRVLMFRQRSGDDVPVAFEGRIKLAIVDSKLIFVASNSIGDIPAALAPATLTPAQAWLAAAAAVPLGTALPMPVPAASDDGWTMLDVAGYTGLQRVRPAIVGLPGLGAVRAFEANVVQLAPSGRTTAYTAYVAADDGRVLVLQDRVDQFSQLDAPRAKADRVEPYNGDYPPGQVGTCGPCHGPFAVSAAENFARLVASASSGNPANDIFVDVYFNDATCALANAQVAHGDTGTSPEAATYSPEGGRVPTGNYYVEVCPYSTLQLPPTNYAGGVLFAEAQAGNVGTNPRWKFFDVTPPLDHSNTDTRRTGCWFDESSMGAPIAGCEDQFADGSSHGIPWDHVGNAGSQTTSGNNARTFEGWNAAIGGGNQYQPAPDPSRIYDPAFSNTWYASSCNPAVITHATPESNDIDAAIVNLFYLHNRLHDFAYQLGLRERNGTAQTSNYGTTPTTREGDPEFGVAQAGALNGGSPSYLGRDNANQVTLQDGVAPLSNMYLWQTIGGAAYTPCVDGDFDGQIVAHEYGHLVQNRMTDPDAGLGGLHGRAMGEGWADMNSMMFFDELGLNAPNAPHRFSVGAYVANDTAKGIRNYAAPTSPLNFGDFGYDNACESPITNVEGTCEAEAQVHADSEIWTAMQFELRTRLVGKYDALGFASTNAALVRRCAEGKTDADRCPGQRRWSQLVHDGMILQPPSPSMLDARNAILAADLARSADPSQTWTSNQADLWAVFAHRGFGESASTINEKDVSPENGFDQPGAGNVPVTFAVRSLTGDLVSAEIFVGRHEARVTPTADTDPASPRTHIIEMVPGNYEFVVRANGYGHFKFAGSVRLPTTTINVRLAPNHAAGANGAVATGAGERHAELIDEREATNWQSLANAPSVDVARPAVTIALAGGPQTVSRVQVSGVLKIVLDEKPQSRFTSIHRFALRACDSSAANCAQDSSYTEVFVSPDGAYPSASFRPIVSDMLLRDFPVTPFRASHLRFVALHNKCTGTPAYHGYLGVAGAEDADPTNSTDCRIGNAPNIAERDVDVRAAEVQAFGAASTVSFVVPNLSDILFSNGFEAP
ncbi:MAG TPA: M36 family metallopeptidase [Candidatus Saccharimonadia bacterium]|nr:M36 family metallopeptidase [Candidatus Saccharimonadia bacterium]